MRGEQKTMTVERVCTLIRQNRLRIPPYQRKFVWDEEQRRLLIDSVRKGLYIGQMILVQGEEGYFEVIDGQQRLKTIFSFVQNQFLLATDGQRLSPTEQDRFLEQPLYFFVLSEQTDAVQIAELFRSTNLRGERLTAQELRHMEPMGAFAEAVEHLAGTLYGSKTHSFLKSEDDFAYYGSLWGRWKLLTQKELAQAADREWLAGLLFCALLERHQPPAEAELDALYRKGTVLYQAADACLKKESETGLLSHLQSTLSLLACVGDPPMPYSKEGFHIFALALYRTVAQSGRAVVKAEGLASAAVAFRRLLHPAIEGEEQYRGMEEYARFQIERYCLEALPNGTAELHELEAVLKKARVETASYEFKQGLLRLSLDRKQDPCVGEHIVKTLCGMANAGLNETAYLFIGIADKESDARRIQELDGIQPIPVEDHYVVGVDREAARMGLSMDEYCRQIKEMIDHSELSDSLRLSILFHIDVLSYRGMSVIRVAVPPQREVSFLGKRLYVRKHSSTIPVTDPGEIVAIAKRFLQS